MSQFCREFLSLINLLATILNFTVPITDIKLFVGKKKDTQIMLLVVQFKKKSFCINWYTERKNGVILT